MPESNYKTLQMESFNTSLPATPSREARIQAILNEQRALAHDALDDLMHEAFLEIGALLSAPDGGDGQGESVGGPAGGAGAPEAAPAHAIAGLSPRTLQLIRQHHSAGDLAEWLTSGADGNKSTCISQFLNLNALQMQELRVRFPRAFMKWTDEEDRALLSLYQEAAAQGKKANWGELARTFGRNTNALRLRLEHLGIDLGPEAGQPRRNRRS